jgi:hypothetical protein
MLPRTRRRYSVWLLCQWRPDVQVEFLGRRMVVLDVGVAEVSVN